MIPLVFWDVDTQKDFIFPNGKLPVPHALEILPHLQKLAAYARASDIRIVMSMDTHEMTDPEISEQPDFLETFPPHCLDGTEGWEKVEETRPEEPFYIESYPLPDLTALVEKNPGDLIVKKSSFNVFSNPNTVKLLEILHPETLVVYGVTTDVCCKYAIEGFLARGNRVIVIQDAVKPIRQEIQSALFQTWKNQGVKLTTTAEFLRQVS